MLIEPVKASEPQTGGVQAKTALPGPLLRGKCQVKANGLRHGPDKVREGIATKLVAAGIPIPEAMRKAGYSNHTSKQNLKYPVKQRLIKVRDKYMMEYVQDIKKEGMDGRSNLKRLAQAVHSSDHYAAIQAIKTHVLILLKNAPSDQQSGFIGVFVVPTSKDAPSWEVNAKELRAVDVKGMIQDADIVLPDPIATALLPSEPVAEILRR